jgi:hypothetical protein
MSNQVLLGSASDRSIVRIGSSCARRALALAHEVSPAEVGLEVGRGTASKLCPSGTLTRTDRTRWRSAPAAAGCHWPPLKRVEAPSLLMFQNWTGTLAQGQGAAGCHWVRIESIKAPARATQHRDESVGTTISWHELPILPETTFNLSNARQIVSCPAIEDVERQLATAKSCAQRVVEIWIWCLGPGKHGERRTRT